MWLSIRGSEGGSDFQLLKGYLQMTPLVRWVRLGRLTNRAWTRQQASAESLSFLLFRNPLAKFHEKRLKAGWAFRKSVKGSLQRSESFPCSDPCCGPVR
ncbi:hypothetical protein MPNT_10388 [Candidatus Methylacidithermus pantelleriae]|uniref:Uncharacterized protein n=1 Tax=Candidatus Methylacidithermus pantelleriae TaxID=2744239 RepID=A0A8J2BJR4_9BACT|nr:hypothetical protein MPNT_10388 [Candidatus Methylacidithermus pantelleriae]